MNMKKLILFCIMTLGVVVAFAQGDSTQSGIGNFYNKYSEAIWIALGASGIITFLTLRLKYLREAIDTLLAAGDEQSPQGRTISSSEWQGIVAAFKRVFWKGEANKKVDIKVPE
jgi:hypothetical protein